MRKAMHKQHYKEIIDYWYSDIAKARWFDSTPKFDDELRVKFEATYHAAVKGELEHWKCNGPGILALVILFDQIPLNIFRGTVESFKTEALSREMACIAIENGWDVELTDEQKSFLYMPFMHSENREDQHRAVFLFEASGLADNAKFAIHHRSIIERFGRFPHRNKMLGRKNSDAEEAYLNSEEAFLG